MSKITKIPPRLNPATFAPIESAVKRKVAGYARVSTDSEEQKTSYTAQVDYYTKYIKGRDDWEFAGVYTDEGISATSTARRTGFNTMIANALDGKIDLIVTKSVSRFARNTVDSLTTIRKLKEKGVEVYFEKESIYTLDSKGELLLTIMSSLSQEESRSISENVTWGQRKRMADGKISLPYGHFLGYRKGENDIPEIVPEEAEIVKFIYRTFMLGKTAHHIAEELTLKKIPTPAGKEVWSTSTIESILTTKNTVVRHFCRKNLLWIFSPRKQKSMRERLHNTILRKATKPLFRRKNLNWCKQNFSAENVSADATTAKVFSRQGLFVNAVADFSAQKSGTPQVNIVVLYGSAITNLRTVKNVQHRIFTRITSKISFWLP
jgi:DNA invertase Pin-like site-specific DNA recombinase